MQHESCKLMYIVYKRIQTTQFQNKVWQTQFQRVVSQQKQIVEKHFRRHPSTESAHNTSIKRGTTQLKSNVQSPMQWPRDAAKAKWYVA